MRKLLSANFSRLWKDKVFWFTLLITFIVSLINIFNGARSAIVMEQRGFDRSLEDYYFYLVPYLGAAYAVFISLFWGTEYTDSTMCNKLVVGHTRADVYLANCIVCFVACLLFMMAWLLGGVPGWFIIGPFEMGWAELFLYFLVAIGFTAAFVALYTWLGTVSTNTGRIVIVSLMVWLALVYVASGIQDRLIPNIQEGVFYINGELMGERVNTEPVPDPLSLRGISHLVCEYILDLLPTGQTLLMNSASIEHPVRQVLFSALFTMVAMMVGMFSFMKKDLK